MADYQYQPDVTDPVVKLRDAMGRMDGMYNYCVRTIQC